jgi:uncharacterized protein
MQGSDTQIDYERLVSDAMRDAMRSVLRTVLTEIAKTGLPGDHHFYISFNTNAPGASLSKRLKEKYPEEMTIVLQHRFWDLFVHADRFEVKLQFNSIPEKLVVPFEAIRVFVDPSVRFGHQFDEHDAGDAEADSDAAAPTFRGAARGSARSAGGITRSSEKRRAAQPRKRTQDVDQTADADDKSVVPITEANTSNTGQDTARSAPGSSATGVPTPAGAAEAPADSGSKVISLDKFRKK